MGPIAIVLISGVSAFQGVKIYSSNGDTFRSFRAKCPLNRGVRISEVRISGVPLYMYIHTELYTLSSRVSNRLIEFQLIHTSIVPVSGQKPWPKV